MKWGCLIVAGLTTLGIVGVVVLLLTAESDGRAPTIDFTDCSPTEQAHLTRVYQDVFADREQFYDFDSWTRMTASSKSEMKQKLMRVWPLKITCAVANDCPYGAKQRGWVVGGDARFTMCSYTAPGNDCDTYAGIVYANGFTRGLREGKESAALFAYARQLCMARDQNQAPVR